MNTYTYAVIADENYISRHTTHQAALRAAERIARGLGKPYYHNLRMFGRVVVIENPRGTRQDGSAI